MDWLRSWPVVLHQRKHHKTRAANLKIGLKDSVRASAEWAVLDAKSCVHVAKTRTLDKTKTTKHRPQSLAVPQSYHAMCLRRVHTIRRAYLNTVAQSPPKKTVFYGTNPPNGISLLRGLSPHPLYSVNKDQLLQLKNSQLKDLLRLPCIDSNKTDTLCMSLLDVIHDNILLNPEQATRVLRAAQGTKYQSMLFDSLKEFYKNDPLRWSIAAFIEDPTDRTHRQMVMTNLTEILSDSKKSNEEASLTALSYLRRLALTDVHNPKSFILTSEHAYRLYNALPVHRRADLFGVMVQINMRFGSGRLYDGMKNYLLRGTQLQRLVVRTGLLDVKSHDILKTDFSENHKQKMVSFYNIEDIMNFVKYQMRRKDVALANLYLDLMVSKFEMMGDASHLRGVLETMIIHSMTFKGPQECIKFFKYILDSSLELEISTLIKVLVELTNQAYYDEALLLVNYMHTEILSGDQKSYLVREIVKIISGKFADYPKIAIGYFASLFGDAGLKILQDLSVLDVIYARSNSDTLYSFISKADIHEDLRHSQLTHAILKEIYTNLFRSLPQAQSTNPALVRKLYDSYRSQIVKQLPESVFRADNMDASIIELFIVYLLEERPNERGNTKLHRDKLRYETAKYIAQDFFSLPEVKGAAKNVHLIELLIQSSMLRHHDLSFAISLIKYAKDLALPMTFKQIYPFIMFHYSKGEQDQAFRWYSLLLQSGIKSNSIEGDELIRVAKELNWPVKGTYFRQMVRAKNRKARREAHKLEHQTVLMSPESDTAENNKEGNFLHELSLILSEIVYAKGTPDKSTTPDAPAMK